MIQMEYYEKLSINERINFKDCFKLLCGYGFSEIGILLSFSERIDLMYQKLKLEGFEV